MAWVNLKERIRLRKSYKSLVNWGRDNLMVWAAQSDAEFAAFREFHAQIAGRVTRSQASWERCFGEIRAGRGALILGFLDRKLVTGALFIDGAQIAVYWSAVSDRSLDIPLGHYVVWHGIGRAAHRSMQWLELGEVPKEGAATPKEVSIGRFKTGFATHILPAEVSPFDPEAEIWRRR